MVHAVVLGANSVKPNNEKPRNKTRKVPRSREHVDLVRQFRPLAPPPKGEKKKECDFETCHDRKARGMAQKGVVQPKPSHIGGNLLVKRLDKARMTSGGVQNPQGKWKEIPAEKGAVGTIMKEKTNTWNKSCMESAKRESEFFKMIEQAGIDER